MALRGICPETGEKAGITYNEIDHECTQCGKSLSESVDKPRWSWGMKM